jgi:hypothetical protein
VALGLAHGSFTTLTLAWVTATISNQTLSWLSGPSAAASEMASTEKHIFIQVFIQ